MEKLPRNRVQTFLAPGLYIPVEHVAGIEVLSSVHRIGVRVDRTTIRGTAPALFMLGLRIIRAAVRVDPSLIPARASDPQPTD